MSNSTRDRVLKTLLAQQRCTINELAEAVEINPISVRHHIARLEAEGLVSSDEERHGVGRPRRYYYLTQAGLERFPTRYVQMSIRLIDQVKHFLPRPMVERMFAQIAEQLVAEGIDEQRLEAMSLEERLNLVRSLLTNEGFNVEWERSGDEVHIRESNCPYLHVGQNHPEVCAIDQTVISTVLSVPVEKVRCVLHGDSNCTYVIPLSVLTEKIS